MSYIEIFIALQASFLAILVPLSLSLSKDLINEVRNSDGVDPDLKQKKIISFWYYSDFLISATAFFGGYSLIIAFLILFRIKDANIIKIFRVLSFLYWLWIFISLWKVLENRIFTHNMREKWLHGIKVTVGYILIWAVFFVFIHNSMLEKKYDNLMFWMSLKSVLLFLFWYAGGIIYLPLTNLFRTNRPAR